MTESARRLVRVMLEQQRTNYEVKFKGFENTLGGEMRREKIAMLSEILAAFDAPANIGDAKTYQDIVISIFRHNDVRPDSSFTHKACIAMMHSAIEAADLKFHGDLDKWVKTIGAGVSGYQPEAYTAMDAAMDELVRLRAKLAAIREVLP